MEDVTHLTSISLRPVSSSQDAMVVILKSLVPGCLFNVIGFGSTFKSLFTTSQNYEEVKQKFCCHRWLWMQT